MDETIWVEIRGKGQHFLLCNTYRPEWTDAGYWTRLHHAIEVAIQINCNIVLTGDFNSDLFTKSNNRLIDLMTNLNLENIINKPTRVTNTSSTLLDPILLSDTMKYQLSDVLNVPPEISDHRAPVVVIQCPNTRCHSFKREVWIYDKANKERMADELDKIEWNELLSDLEGVDEMCEKFMKIFMKIARECIPTKRVTVRNNDKPWFTNELRKEIRKRDRVRKNALKTKREQDIVKTKNKEIESII